MAFHNLSSLETGSGQLEVACNFETSTCFHLLSRLTQHLHDILSKICIVVYVGFYHGAILNEQ